MNQLGADPQVKVYLCQGDAPAEIDASHFGHFFKDSVYVVDIQGAGHRYLIQWFGTRLPSDKVSAYRQYMATLTEGVFAPREITRVSVMSGHEDNSLLTFFPNGFICHQAPFMDVAEKVAADTQQGALYRISGSFGSYPSAVQ